MTRLATMGTSSCATIAIAGFKPNQKELNEKYKESKNPEMEPKNTIQNFYHKILWPQAQPLGHTGEYPFELLMEKIEESKMKDKFIIITLNKRQKEGDAGYWPKELKRWGFSLIDATKNNIGQPCYVYTRNLARIDY